MPAAFEQAEAAVAPVQDIREVRAEPRYQVLDAITTVPDPELGPLRMQNSRCRRTPAPARES